jgi:hypothetical protein
MDRYLNLTGQEIIVISPVGIINQNGQTTLDYRGKPDVQQRLAPHPSYHTWTSRVNGKVQFGFSFDAAEAQRQGAVVIISSEQALIALQLSADVRGCIVPMDPVYNYEKTHHVGFLRYMHL